jgi:nucleoside-diphosphate-sugar epimerase
MKKLLVTGATGFIGSNTIESLKKLDLEIHAATVNGTPDDKDINWVKFDLLNDLEAEKSIKKITPDILLHLAWGIKPSEYNMNSNYDWFTASVKLIDWFRKYGGKRMIIIGSGFEYDWSYGVCHEEITPLKADTLYGECKSLLFQYVNSYSKNNDLSFAWPRVFFTFGPNEDPKRLVPYVITQLLNDQKAIIRSGDLYRDYIYVKDIGSIITELVDSDFTGPVNVARGIPLKIKDIVNKIGSLLGKQELIHFENNDKSPHKLVVANTEVLHTKIGYTTKVDMSLALEETIDYWKSQAN